MPRIIFISDTHGHHSKIKIPEGDILVHSGDFSMGGEIEELEEFYGWFERQPHEHKILIAGNHDFCFEREPEAARKIVAGTIYLQDEAVTVSGVKFYGSPWQPWFFDWAFNLPRGKPLAKVWQKIPSDTHVLVTHSPPFGILDRIDSGTCCGCEELLKRVEKVQPKLHLFGHIHEGYGTIKVGETTFVNGAICDKDYKPRNAAQVLDV